MTAVSLRPLERGDLPQLASWLTVAHVAEWWHGDEDVEAALAGNDPTRWFAILLGGHPVGAIETYLVSDYPAWEAVARVGPGVAGVDLLIGEPEAIGQGVGPEALRLLVRDVVFADPSVHACVAGVDAENERSLRAFAKAGFQPSRDYVEDGRPHRLLRLERAG
jgi:aminoglycoside 6'-N-acetyltransferase